VIALQHNRQHSPGAILSTLADMSVPDINQLF